MKDNKLYLSGYDIASVRFNFSYFSKFCYELLKAKQDKRIDFTAHEKNVGFSISTRATEPQMPEGKVVFALNLFKASAV